MSRRSVRIESRSRAAVLLPNQTVLRLDEGTALTFTQVKPAEPSLLELLQGAIHFLSRTPAQLRIHTPFSAAGVEGTEFVLRVTENATQLWVFEGRVRFANAQGSLMLASGEAATAQAGRAPQRRVVVRPREAVQWALYYPPLIDYRLSSYPSGEQGIREALKFYRQDDLTSAFASLDKVPDEARDASYYALSAGLLLNVGRVDEARVDIDRALRLDPKNATAFSLQSVVAMVQNEQEQALYLARKAEELDPQSPIPKVALSYAYQAKFDIEKALENIEQAIALAPTDALAYARLSELQLSQGDLQRALGAAKTAVALDPGLARTQEVLGFAYLTEIDIERAKASFQRAIELDPASPLARLGLGLGKIRDGALKEGTQEIELAASLDPNNSLVRSYLGKAYFEERRAGVASSEFALAKALDPNDPTPWFYDAIHKQTTNRPVEALHDLQRAIELNDNRAVYRSRLLLDEDLAARSASLGRIYNDLGFQQLGLVEGWKSVNSDLSNYSAHRLLADNYAALPRHEIARVSELLQSQLLQPLNVTPVQPNLGESNLLILEGSGPSNPSFNEFNPLFARDRLALQTSGVFGSNDTLGDEVTQSGLWGKYSYSLGQFHYETDGFRENNDLEQNIYNVFAQASLSSKFGVQAEFRHRETKTGDLDLNFDLNDFDPSRRREERADIFRLGAHYAPAPRTDFILSAIHQDKKESQRTRSSVFNTDPKAYQVEIQGLIGAPLVNTVIGAGYYDQGSKIEGIIFRSSRNIPINFNTDVEHENIYWYSTIEFLTNITATVGTSFDAFETKLGDLERNQVNPKFGLTWDVTPSITIRMAAFRALKRVLVGSQSIEPTQVAGFNQFFDDTNAADSKRYGVAVDHKFSERLFAGWESSKRDIEIPRPAIGDVDEQEEWLHRAYLFWAPFSRLAFGLEYQFESLERAISDSDPKKLKTHELPLGVNYYHPNGFFANLQTTYVDQEVTVGIPRDKRGDRFWLVDLGVGYRLPKRWGLVSVDLKNLFNTSFNFQDRNFQTVETLGPPFEPERVVFANVILAF